ncbi:DUF1707 SHOCT-like domain-containing protein [Streptomyces chrestomyceticus]|uniref:DUF1707 SHOCT-like domain-containing protein n=1 Tax=Streptomyces chrestomyceticus TaxID=68185 RepID=UPI0035A88D23
MSDEKVPTDGGTQDEQAAMRASDADREQVAEILRDAAGDGRLTLEEVGERVESALRARTVGELARLTRDLPVSPLPAESRDQPGRGKDVVEIDQRWGTLHRSGAWEVPRRLEVRMHGGDVKLDFTEAEFSHARLDLDVQISVGGNLVLVVRPGIVVHTDDLTVKVGEVKYRNPASDAQAPVEREVYVTGRLKGGDVVVRHPRRTLGRWLRGDDAKNGAAEKS